MTTYKLLSLDESGKASYDHSSSLFILAGTVVPERFKPKLDRSMRKLKKRYFRNEEIVFHSRDMYRKKGQFTTLEDPKTDLAFWIEFIEIVEYPKINLIFVVVDKQKAKAKGWNQKTILKRAYLKALEEFAAKHLKRGINGKIITESAPPQDFYLIQAHNNIQSTGTSDRSMTAKEYRQKVTSLCLVNKANLDIDVQLADALAPIAGRMYILNVLNKQLHIDEIERMKQELIEKKLANKANPSIFNVLI